MILTTEQIINATAALITLFLFLFAIDWRFFRDWIVVYLFANCLAFVWSSPIVNLGLIDYPVRLLPHFYNTSILFELWVFPVLCILYNQITRESGLWPVIYYALFFSAGIVAVEYPLELYTELIVYKSWTWFTSLYTLTFSFLIIRIFIAFYRWGCIHFGNRQ
ncbi:Hypothetical protein LUCI_3063 [Lucifera butyrica]|uniref:Uncharacterized protein n=1 Tax=Lucifera butyrica TaxID=1351585 RepID=A0A498RFC0_9FIRM|nr:CBO0543 family protein [Lucifera butyrica]VBB07798.1 Hypothetical protein LUCI_3063 [Lucifera butyrica]